MNNWRLLLLAVVAVFQPIASFTDRNLIDGRQQCCDRLSSAPHQDTRSSLHGKYRLGETSALRRLNDRDETREDRRYELRQRDSIFSRPSTERPVVDTRGRVARQSPSEIARYSRVEHHLERPTKSQSRERLLDVPQREETARSIRDLKHQDLTRRTDDRSSRDALGRRNDRIFTESPRGTLLRDVSRTERLGNERLSKNLFDSQREMPREQIRYVERRIALNRDARHVLSRAQDDVTIEASNSMNNRQRVARERLSAVRRVSSIRPDTRRYSEHNDERRDLQRYNQQRRSLSANTRLVDRIRDMLVRYNVRDDTRENQQRFRTSQRISNELDEGRVQREERRETRQQNKENINRNASVERRMQVARKITRDSRIMNVMNIRNERNEDERREIRHERMSREIQDKIQENPENRLSRERILMARINIREARIMNAQNMRDVADRREIRHNERMTSEVRDENRGNLEQRLSRERIQMDRRNIRETRIMNAQNKREVADRREIRHSERVTSEVRDENRGNLEQRLTRERIQMDRRNIRETRIVNAQNIRDVADRRDTRSNERMTREVRDENRENLEQRLSRERIQMDRRNIRESRIMNDQNTRDVADRRETKHNERTFREVRDENREHLEQRLTRERIQMDRRNIREARIMNAQNTREDADRRENRYNERRTREIRDENREHLEQRLSRESIKMDRKNVREARITNAQNTRDVDRREIRHSERNTRDERENHINRLSLERVQGHRRNIREFRMINNLSTRDDDRRIDNRRETRFSERISKETRDDNRVNPDHRLSLERIQIDRKNIRELRTVNTHNDKDMDGRREIRYTERSTEIRNEARLNPEQRISRERIQLDRRNIRDFRNMNIVMRTDKDVESRQTDARLHRITRENPEHRLSRESIQMDRRDTRESRIGNTRHVRNQDSRHEIRESEETREEMRENPERSLARESRQVDRRNIRVSSNRLPNRSVESDSASRREIRYNERLSGRILGDQVTRERRLESRSADRVTAEERDSSMMNRRTRSVDRQIFREIRAEPRLTRSTESERRSVVFRSRVEHNHKVENREREAFDGRSRNVEMSRNHERSPMIVGKMEPVNDLTVANWQYVLYTLQAAYLCALFVQMMTPSSTDKAHKISLRWLPVSSHYNPIKVD